MNDQKTVRILSIDIFRGYLLILMVLVHFVVYWGDSDAVNTLPYFFLNHVIADWGAAGFLMMMGMSQVFSAQRHEGENKVAAFKRAMVRGDSFSPWESSCWPLPGDPLTSGNGIF